MVIVLPNQILHAIFCTAIICFPFQFQSIKNSLGFCDYNFFILFMKWFQWTFLIFFFFLLSLYNVIQICLVHCKKEINETLSSIDYFGFKVYKFLYLGTPGFLLKFWIFKNFVQISETDLFSFFLKYFSVPLCIMSYFAILLYYCMNKVQNYCIFCLASRIQDKMQKGAEKFLA